MDMQSLIRSGLIVLLAVAATPASASIITLDFDGVGTPFGQTVPYLEDGFRITPVTCHWDISGGGNNPNGTNWFGFDASGCASPPAALRLDLFGSKFHLLSMEVVADPIFRLASSGGGDSVINASGCDFGELCTRTFTGSEWRNLTFLDFTILADFGDPQGFDNMRLLVVDEPASVALLAFAALGMLALARRRRGSLTRSISSA